MSEGRRRAPDRRLCCSWPKTPRGDPFAREAGFAGLLLETVTPSSLLYALRRTTRQCILVAEENMVNREIAQALLQLFGRVVLPVADGKHPVRRVLDEASAPALMDMEMPVLANAEAARQRRASGARIPVIAMTANAFGQDRRRSLEVGMDDHLPKPVDQWVLYLELLKLLPIQGTSG